MGEKRLYWTLFKSTFMLSAFTFGGGYVIVPLLKKKFTDGLHWLTEDEMMELVAIGQSSPGAIAINTACLLGWRKGGARGAICGLFGTILPPMIILSVVYAVYAFVVDNVWVAALMRGMQAGIAAVIADVVCGMASVYFKKTKLPSLAIMLAAFAATWFFGVNVAVIILVCAALGALWAIVVAKRGGGKAQ